MVNNSKGTENSSALMFVCFIYSIVKLLFMLILQKLLFYKESVLRFMMLISMFFTSSKKGYDSSNRMVGLVRSTIQKFQRINELEFCILLLCYHYIIVYAVFTSIMLLQRSNIIWFYEFQSL